MSSLSSQSGIYLICFDQPYHHARHYLGWSSNISSRISAHKSSQGSSLISAVNKSGISWTVVRTWPNLTRSDERKMKNKHNTASLCPRCEERYRLLQKNQKRTLRRARKLFESVREV